MTSTGACRCRRRHRSRPRWARASKASRRVRSRRGLQRPVHAPGRRRQFTSCAALKSFSGYDGANGSNIILVRNPNYDQSTDPYRKNYIDEFKFVINSNADDIFAKVQPGSTGRKGLRPTPKTIRQYATTSSLKPRMIPNVGDRTYYITMNLTQPPFDDIHVREGDELHHRQGGAAEGVWRPDRGLYRHTHRPARALQQRPRRVRPVRDAE